MYIDKLGGGGGKTLIMNANDHYNYRREQRLHTIAKPVRWIRKKEFLKNML